MIFTPGEKYEYSNTGYVLLASIVEKLLGKILLNCQENGFSTSKNDKYINTNQSRKKLNNLAYGHKKDSLGRFVNADNFYHQIILFGSETEKGPVNKFECI